MPNKCFSILNGTSFKSNYSDRNIVLCVAFFMGVLLEIKLNWKAIQDFVLSLWCPLVWLLRVCSVCMRARASVCVCVCVYVRVCVRARVHGLMVCRFTALRKQKQKYWLCKWSSNWKGGEIILQPPFRVCGYYHLMEDLTSVKWLDHYISTSYTLS